MSPRASFILVAVVLGAAVAGCATPTALLPPTGGGPEGGSLLFKATSIPGSSGASEPSIAVDHKGIVYVSAPTGLPSASKMWKSEDMGGKWTELVPNPTSLGGGDTSIAIGPKDEVYVTDLWAGSSTISATFDGGKTWTTSPISSEVPYYDREWNTVDGKGHAYFLGRTFTPGAAAWVSRSDDGGKTWVAQGNPWINPSPNEENQDGPFITNPKTDEIAVVYNCPVTDASTPISTGAVSGHAVCVSISKDLGLTWSAHPAARVKGSVGNDFAGLAADTAGNWYVAFAESTTDGTILKWATSADGAKWSEPMVLREGPGNRMFPWIVAGDAGRIAIAWYDTDKPGNTNDHTAMKDAQWNLKVAISIDALAPDPTFEVASATEKPVHTGTISTQGFDPTSQDPPDRSLGDFFTSYVGPDGRVHLAFMQSLNNQKDITTIYAVQVAGPNMYVSGHAPAAPGGGSGSGLPPIPTLPVVVPHT
jgi:hypothetical protein